MTSPHEKFIYLRSGKKCREMSRSDDTVFVATRVTHEGTWDDEHTTWEEDGEILCVPTSDIFDSPPIQVLAEKVVKLNAQIAELKVKRQELKSVVTDEQRQYEQSMARYAQFSHTLARLDEFIRQKNITHYFLHEKYSVPEILSVEDTLLDRGYSHKREGRLLSLTPLKGRVLTWTLNQYGDGSGSDHECTPCTSHREALALAQRWIEQQIASGEHTRRIIKFAQKHHLALPDNYIVAVTEHESQQLTHDELGQKAKMADARRKKEQEWKILTQDAESNERGENTC